MVSVVQIRLKLVRCVVFIGFWYSYMFRLNWMLGDIYWIRFKVVSGMWCVLVVNSNSVLVVKGLVSSSQLSCLGVVLMKVLWFCQFYVVSVMMVKGVSISVFIVSFFSVVSGVILCSRLQMLKLLVSISVIQGVWLVCIVSYSMFRVVSVMVSYCMG